MTDQLVLISAENGVGVVTLNRPDAMNAFVVPLTEQLAAAVQEMDERDDVRCVVITASGKAFSAGQDLRERLYERTDSLGDALRNRFNPTIARIRRMDKPVIAAVNGVAAGAGCSLALACDLRIASDRAQFLWVFARVGLAPDTGSSWFLPRLIGTGRALELLFTGDPLSADEALRLGIVNRIVPHDDLLPAALELATRLARGPARAIALNKRAVEFAATSDLDAALAYEAGLQDQAERTADHQEGLLAFVQKRAARFTGR